MPWHTDRRSPGLGLLCDEGRGSLEQIALHPQPLVLALELLEPVALVRAPVLALTRVDLVLQIPPAQRLGRHTVSLAIVTIDLPLRRYSSTASGLNCGGFGRRRPL